ncbi:MAG: glutathione synthase [Pseudomonadota bacterium]|nr:glutathione synthase [Pseudomonadota bacterium]
MKNMKLGVVMDPIEAINPKKDSTLAMLLAAQQRDWQIFYFLPQQLILDQGRPKGHGRVLRVNDNLDHWYSLGDSQLMDLERLDVILMRQEPPFDSQFLSNTFILEAAERLGTLIINRPQSLRDCNEKIFATEFPQCCPPSIISAVADDLRYFHVEHQDIILKPLDGMGGSSIFRVKPNDPNLNVIIETLTDYQSRSIMAQRYLPEISAGDKRILLIDGKPQAFALARMPATGETRGNLAAGGTGVAQPLSDRDYWICEQIAPRLKEKGLMFVGIDVIGDFLTEINVTCPTCIRELDAQCGLDIGGALMACIASKL